MAAAAASAYLSILRQSRAVSAPLPPPIMKVRKSGSFERASLVGGLGIGLSRSPRVPPSSPPANTPQSSTELPAGGHHAVELCSLSHLPGCTVKRYLGVISLYLIKESWAVRSQSELGNFFHVFLTEVNAMMRAHAASLGANALLCYTTTPEESTSRASRNQVYHMMSATGHAVLVSPVRQALEEAAAADPTDPRIARVKLRLAGPAQGDLPTPASLRQAPASDHSGSSPQASPVAHRKSAGGSRSPKTPPLGAVAAARGKPWPLASPPAKAASPGPPPATLEMPPPALASPGPTSPAIRTSFKS